MSTKKTFKVVESTDKNANKKHEILAVLAQAQERVGVAQLASQVDLSVCKTSRILTTLSAKGLVEGLKGHYRLVFSSATLAQKQFINRGVINIAHPVLTKLANDLDEAVYLTIPKEDEVLFLDMADGCQKIKTEAFLGRLFPFFSNAAGKVMRSLDSRDLVEKLLKRIGRNKGARAIEMLDLELQDIRSKGVAVDRSGLGEGICSVAVAIRDYSGAVIGAIILIGPSFRVMTERLEKEIIPALKEGADLLSGSFGYCPV